MKTRSLWCAFAALLVAGLAVAVPADAGASLRLATVRYAVAERVCNAPAPGEKACFAMKLVQTTKDAPGAQPMAVSGAVGHGRLGGYSPADLARVYHYNRAAPTDMTVAIVDAYDDPRAKSDLNHFDEYYGLPAETSASFLKVNQRGGTTPPPPNASWAVEIALDVQAVRAVCNTCTILLVEADSSSSFDLARAVNTAAKMGADVISNSYGGAEQRSEPLWVRNAYDHPGVVITASTGDDGWYSWDKANNGSRGWSYNRPNTPAAYKTVVAVTGTKLTTTAAGFRAKETVWNGNGAHDRFGLRNGFFRGAQGASGGGCSKIYSAPAWQAGVAGFHKTGCGTHRLVGDIAAVGDPATGFSIYNTYRDVGWSVLGGTSLSAPLIGAMWALAGGAGPEKYPGKLLYDRLTYTPGFVTDLRTGSNAFCGGDTKSVCSAALRAQITTGNPNNLANGNHHYRRGWAGLLDCGYVRNGGEATVVSDKQCNATTGYDGPTGIGAPAGLTTFQPLIETSISVPNPVLAGAPQNWSAITSDPAGGAVITGYRWAWGDGSGAETVDAVPTQHQFNSVGTYTVTLTVTDNHGLHGRTSVTVQVTS